MGCKFYQHAKYSFQENTRIQFDYLLLNSAEMQMVNLPLCWSTFLNKLHIRVIHPGHGSYLYSSHSKRIGKAHFYSLNLFLLKKRKVSWGWCTSFFYLQLRRFLHTAQGCRYLCIHNSWGAFIILLVCSIMSPLCMYVEDKRKQMRCHCAADL